MPKWIGTDDPDSEYVQGHIRLIRFGTTIYLYLKGYAHPIMTRKCGDEVVAKTVFSWLKRGFSTSLTLKALPKTSLRNRLCMLWWKVLWRIRIPDKEAEI